MVTTKSGANDLHGSVTGGRIRRDKTFFFLGYSGQLRGQQDTSRVNLPTTAFRNGDFSALTTPLRAPRGSNDPFPGNRIPQSAWSPLGVGLLALYPQPNTVGGLQNFTTAAATKNEAHQFMVRGDHRFSRERQRLPRQRMAG